ncbi:MAG: GNAT family N-acetyltransferase [Candidatus Kapaibacteriales bacterium]
MVQIIKADDKLSDFIQVQFEICGNDPNWVPPLKFERKKLLNKKKNPFYQHSKMALFLAKKEGKFVGRIAAIINDNHNQTHDDKVGFFGFFDSINNIEVAKILFDEATKWLKSQGMESIRGPVNPSMNDECGLLIDGFDSPPVTLMTYNPPYYQDLIEGYGFNNAKDLYAYKLINGQYKSEKLSRLDSALRNRYGIEIKALDFKNKARFKEGVEIIKSIYNAAWEKNWGFVKFTDEEFDALAADLKSVADADYALIAYIKGKPVGFALGLPDINQTLIYNRNGGLLKGIFHLLTKKSKIDTLRIIVLGVIEDYRNKGIDAILYNELGDRGLKKGIKYGEASWILEDNEEMKRAATQIMKGELYKTYRIYEKSIV